VYPIADIDVSIQLLRAPAGVEIAASALDVGDEKVHRYHITGGRNFVWSASPEYQVFQERVGDVTIMGYAFLPDTLAGEAAFQVTVDAYRLYSEIYAPYPHESITMVQADFLHGMEYQGLYFLSRGFFNTYDGTEKGYLTMIAAHETAHQWFYGMVANDQAMEPWLDEALCTYSERLFYEYVYPDSLDWWWAARVDYYEPEGFVDSNIYYTPGYYVYRNAVYLQGAKFLEGLRKLTGDDAFMAFLRDYVTQNSGNLVTGDDFFAILQEHSQVDISSLMEMYFEGRK
jgi:aminopeptidase N